MFELTKITALIEELSKVDLEKLFNNLHDQVAKFKVENANLKNDIDDLTNQNEIYKNKINELEEEINNYRKVSFIQSVDKQLNEKINYISILESQLLKYKNKENDNNHVNFNIENKDVKDKKKKKEILDFDPENFEEINGYELLCYKKRYYLRDLETSEIYDILNNQPNVIVGLLTSSGKIKLNKI